MLRMDTTLPVRLRAAAGIGVLAGVGLMLAACGPRDSRPVETPTASPTLAEQRVACTYAASLDGALDEQMLLARPDQTVQKSWTVRNDGTCDWTGVTLVLVSASGNGTAEMLPVPAAAAQSSVELAVDLTAPRRAGDYSGEWRLQAPDGALFGPTLRVEMAVQAYPPATPQSPYGVVAEAGCVLDAAYVADITLADGTIVQPDEALQKIWRVQNTGTCDWQEDFSLIFHSGDPIGSSSPVAIPPTRSGETADIEIHLTAPAQDGTYTGWWRLQAPDGTMFGVSLYAQISVGIPTAGGVPVQTPYSSYIHNISYHSREIFLDGQARGSRANVFTKVGDSITDVWAFLNPIGDGVYALHDYAYLQPAINYFSQAPVRSGSSFNNKSLAAVWGWSSADVLNPAHVAGTCPGMTPLACEYSQVQPSLAIILIGANDMLSGAGPAAFEGNLRQIVEVSIQYGVIPVLSTVPYNQFGDVQPFNQVIIATAVAYDIPWMDFYGATWDLANHGISWEDGVHPSIPATNDPTNFTPDNLNYGHTVRNLLALHVLDALWRQVLAY